MDLMLWRVKRLLTPMCRCMPLPLRASCSDDDSPERSGEHPKARSRGRHPVPSQSVPRNLFLQRIRVRQT
jgi:hypothetical protein